MKKFTKHFRKITATAIVGALLISITLPPFAQAKQYASYAERYQLRPKPLSTKTQTERQAVWESMGVPNQSQGVLRHALGILTFLQEIFKQEFAEFRKKVAAVFEMLLGALVHCYYKIADSISRDWKDSLKLFRQQFFPHLTQEEYSQTKAWWEDVLSFGLSAIFVGIPVYLFTGSALGAVQISFLSGIALYLEGHKEWIANVFGSRAPPEHLAAAKEISLWNLFLNIPSLFLIQDPLYFALILIIICATFHYLKNTNSIWPLIQPNLFLTSLKSDMVFLNPILLFAGSSIGMGSGWDETNLKEGSQKGQSEETQVIEWNRKKLKLAKRIFTLQEIAKRIGTNFFYVLKFINGQIDLPIFQSRIHTFLKEVESEFDLEHIPSDDDIRDQLKLAHNFQSQSEIAAALGVTRSAISQKLTSENIFRSKTVRTILNYLRNIKLHYGLNPVSPLPNNESIISELSKIIENIGIEKVAEETTYSMDQLYRILQGEEDIAKDIYRHLLMYLMSKGIRDFRHDLETVSTIEEQTIKDGSFNVRPQNRQKQINKQALVQLDRSVPVNKDEIQSISKTLDRYGWNFLAAQNSGAINFKR